MNYLERKELRRKIANALVYVYLVFLLLLIVFCISSCSSPRYPQRYLERKERALENRITHKHARILYVTFTVGYGFDKSYE